MSRAPSTTFSPAPTTWSTIDVATRLARAIGDWLARLRAPPPEDLRALDFRAPPARFFVADDRLLPPRLDALFFAEERLAELRLAVLRFAPLFFAEERLALLFFAEERLAEERLAEERFAEERFAEERLDAERPPDEERPLDLRADFLRAPPDRLLDARLPEDLLLLRDDFLVVAMCEGSCEEVCTRRVQDSRTPATVPRRP